jgi:uroporphyrinogen-III synthase
MPTDYSSEGLLALAPLKKITGQKIYLCCGKGSREFLPEKLRARGATVELIECYERRPAKLEPDTVEQITTTRPHLIITTSQEILRHLDDLLRNSTLAWLKKVPLLITHATHLRLAQELGYQPVFISNSATTQDVLAKIIELNSKLIELGTVP